MKKQIRWVLNLTIIALSSIAAANAQVASNPPYTLDQSVIASGGGMSSNGGNFKIEGTIGQAAAGTLLSNSPFAIQGGFWTWQPAAPAPSADLLVTKTAAPDPVAAGANLAYTITVTNNGAGEAQSVQLTDTLPANTTFVSEQQNSGPAFTCTNPAAGATGTVSCTIATLASGASAVFTLTVNVASGTTAGTTISNTASVSSTTSDPNSVNNSATTATIIATIAAASADLSVTKVDTPDPVVPGNNITYTITLTNNGPDAATDVVLVDTVPVNTTFQSLSTANGFTCTTPSVGGTGNITCNAASLANGATATFTFVVKVNANTPADTFITNTASVASSVSDSNNGNNAATATTTVTGTTPPTILAQNWSRGRNTSANIKIATVNDADQTEETLVVTATPTSGTGVTITNITVSSTGVVTADVTVSPTATTSTLTLKVTDSSKQLVNATLTISVFSGGRPVSPANP